MGPALYESGMARHCADLRGHTRIPPEKLAGLLTGIGNVIDEAGGSFTMGYTAVVVTAKRCLV